jgi:hypothetical protein
MRHIYLMMLLGVAAGCASVSDVPLPMVTQYDGNRRARSAYLEGYRDGYRYFVAGGTSDGPEVFSDDPIAKARMYGWYDGTEAAMVRREGKSK